MRRKLSILTLAALLAVSCSKESETPGPGAGQNPVGAQIAFTYANPAATRVPGDPVPASDAEKLIRDMDVFMFLADGTFVRQLGTGDYSSADNAGTTSLTLTDALLEDYAGRQAVFYFVANNTASTGGTHITAFEGATEDEFRELLTKPLPAADAEDRVRNITVAANTGGLLMTGRSATVTLAGKHAETITLKRRTARFDLYNPGIADNVRIDNFYISDAATQTTLFANASEPHTIAYRSTEIVWGPDTPDGYGPDGIARSVFYLYPTSLETTRIAVEVGIGEKVKMFYLDSDIAIEANKRYLLVFDGDDLTVDSKTGDWGEGGNP